MLQSRYLCAKGRTVDRPSPCASLSDSPGDAQGKQDNYDQASKMLFRMTSSIVKTTVDHPTALNTLSKSLSASLG